MSHLIKMEKDGASLRVHPTTVNAHKAAGWAVAADQGKEPTEGGNDLASLRAEYEAKLGKKPFGGWKADELRKRIAEGEKQ